MSSEIRQKYEVNGQSFDTKAEAQDFLRTPKIKTALLAVTAGKVDLTDWLLENRESVEMAFEVGKIRRVTKSEKKKLEKAVDALVEGFAHEPKISFLIDHAEAIKSSFSWPGVKRMSDEEKAAAARNTLVIATEGREDVADWIVSNKEAILAAYAAGIDKPKVSPKATEGLIAYRLRRAAEKAAKEAAVG
jgi:hypothetical protein